ncbi:glycosyltransferase family 4 protein [uncultured Bacteroides sp.]|uniref:glycosyltransferase family 4 protein n=1 Tax=uncultured Bacteroides sp. TaxID=162156 RepID=UPI002AAAC28C|nr:glycosyltransferase family 4 protein [uncultured Bacteroides sp.]
MSRITTKRILISVTNDLIADQRVGKVSASLQSNGYNVLLIGCIRKKRQPLKRPYQTYRFNLFFKKRFVFFMEYNLRLLFVLLFKRKDILLCNDTDALLANFIASKLCRVPLVFDAHELYPELPEVVERPLVKKVWEKIEDIIFPHLKYSYTVCESIAEHYKQKYGITMGVVRNIPNKETTSAPADNNQKIIINRLPSLVGKKLLLYQGAINVGRGVDWLINAMPYLDNCVLCICGDGYLFQEMQTLAKGKQLEDQIIFTGRLPFEELNQYTSQADLGFVLLENMGLSYYYSLPNRIFDYMKYGVPVLASNLPEIARIMETHNTGKLISHYEPEYLAKVILEMLEEWKDKPVYKQRLNELSKKFCWENEEQVMLGIVGKAK